MHDTKVRQAVYLVLAAVGLVGTWYFNIQWFNEHRVLSYLRGTYANSAASSFSVDITVSFIAGSIFMYFEGKRIGMRNTWIYGVVSLTIAFAFAFPLFLWVRERHLATAAAAA